MLLALLHAGFPKYFDWEKELRHLSLINKQLMEVHTFFIAVGVFLIGGLCLTHAHDLMTTSLGKTISLGLAIFWTLRLITQFVWYTPKLWKGKVFETSMHVLFSAFWFYVSGVFWMVYVSHTN
jgi:hypothetical protein